MALSTPEIRDLYDGMARRYDRNARAFRLGGFHEPFYKRQAINALDLKPGDTVVDVGCGTGLNFALLQQRVGPGGHIIGIDLTPGMLAQASRRIERNGWRNVTLVQSDAAQFDFPEGIDAILSTFVLIFVPGYGAVINNGFSALRHGGRFSVLDMRKPDRWPSWIVRLMIRTSAPFEVSLDQSTRQPWRAMQALTGARTRFSTYYGGFVYLAVATRP
jgi:ubiquinone/menaquinone biosynthesis C-methylase UbiE